MFDHNMSFDVRAGIDTSTAKSNCLASNSVKAVQTATTSLSLLQHLSYLRGDGNAELSFRFSGEM
jgi:hypothetical protein